MKFGAILKYHEWYLCQISRAIHAISCLYYNVRSSVIKHHVFIFVELFRFVGEQIGFVVLVFGPAGPDIEPGRCTSSQHFGFPNSLLVLESPVFKI